MHGFTGILMGVDATSKQTGGKDWRMEGAVYIIIPYSRRQVDVCDAPLVTNLNLAPCYFSSSDSGQQRHQGEFVCAAAWGRSCSRHQRRPLSCSHVPGSESCTFVSVDVFFLVVFAYCLSFIATSCSLIVVSSWESDELADTSPPISEVSP